MELRQMLAVFFRSHSDIYLFSFSLHDNGNFKNVRAYVEYRVVYEKLKMCSFRSTNRPYAYVCIWNGSTCFYCCCHCCSAHVCMCFCFIAVFVYVYTYEWVRKTAVKIVCVNDENPKASKQASKQTRQSKQFTGKQNNNKSGNCRTLVVVRWFSIFISLLLFVLHSCLLKSVCVYARIWEYDVNFVRVYGRALDLDAANSLLHLNSCRCTSV